MNIIVAIIAIAAALIIGGLCGFMIFRFVIKGKYNEMVDAATKEAEVIKEKKLLEVKEKFLNKKSELEKEVQQRNQHIQQSENKLKQREISLNQRQEELGRRKNDLDNQQTRIDNEKKLLNLKQEELEKMQLQERAKLEELSGLSADEAKARLVESLKDEAKTDAAAYINEIMEGLVVGKEKGKYLLRSYWNAPDDVDGKIMFKSDRLLNEGDIVNVKILESYVYDLYGEIVD